jgi:hypothetical protein
MESKSFHKSLLVSFCLLAIPLSSCLFVEAGIVSTATPVSIPTESPSTEMTTTDAPASPSSPLQIVFAKEGDLYIWDEASQQAQILLDTGDAVDVAASDDGGTIAFTRHAWEGDSMNGHEQFSLWAMNRDGGNLRELISAQDLRQRLQPEERYSSNFYQLGWVPGTHQLIFSGTTYIVQAEGLSHAIPQGVYLVDTDQGAVTTLADASENLRFLPSPDGKQIALISPNATGFINTDGSDRRRDLLTYAEAGLTGPLFPMGVWTQDSGALIVTGSFARDENYNTDFSIWRVPADGSSLASLASIIGSHPNSVTYSPDGKSVAFLQTTDQPPSEIAGYAISPLTPEAGPLALPFFGKEPSYANLHWSPSGDAFTIKDQDLFRLCPGASQDTQVCGDPIHLTDGIITKLEWMDASRFLFEGIEPNTLSLGSLDGTITPIATWLDVDFLPGGSYAILH